MIDPLKLAIAVLATYRLSHLISEEMGPFNIILRIRMSLANWPTLAGWMDCPQCNSVLIGLGVVGLLALGMAWVTILITGIAVSGAVIYGYRK